MIRPLFCAVVCLFLFTSAKADTFTLTSGSANTGLNQFSLFASGPNISIAGNSGTAQGDFAFATCNPSPCAPGSILNVGGLFITAQFAPGNNFGGTATINGVTFFGVNFSGNLNFTGSIVLPANYVNGQVVNVPFSMQGPLAGFIRCPGNPFGCTQQVFDITVIGSGIATATLPVPGHTTVIYNFQPVPEPATLGLLGAGLFAFTRLYRSRNKR